MSTSDSTAMSHTTRELPSQARVVVIGGGVIGASVAYHLAAAGEHEVLLLERDQLTSGTTWHAAGLMCTFGSMSSTSTELRQYTRALYTSLEAETGLSTGFRAVGYLPVVSDADRLHEYRRIAAFNRHHGVEVHEVSPGEVADLFPLARTDDLLAGFYVPGDGRANPVDVTMSLAKGAKQRGATLVEGVAVTDVLTRTDPAGRRHVTGVRTNRGEVACEYVVNCAGMWARQLGEQHGVSLPLQAAEHYYLVTEQIEGLHRDLPVLEDPTNYGYYREEVGGLMVGLFEAEAAPWKVEGIPEDFSFGTLAPDWDRMSPYLEAAMTRVPIAAEVGIRTFFCGPESFTPDLSPLVGPTPEIDGYFVAAGMNSVGILTGGGIGRVIAEWILTGDPGVDVTAMGVDRLQPVQATAAYRRARTAESLGWVYAAHYPYRTPSTARGIRLSALHDRLQAQGARFKDVSGWESPDWYDHADNLGHLGSAEPTLGWHREPWFDHWALEHRAARESVIAMDMSFMAKFLVIGAEAGAFLNYLSTNDVDGESGRITYTAWLNERGTLEADLTVTKLDDHTFWVIASDTAHRHVHTHLLRQAARWSGAPVSVTDVTSGYTQLNLQGPRSRELLSQASDADLSNEAFPFRRAAYIDIGMASPLCIRITYLGELGYELYIPTEQARYVYDQIIAADAVVSTGLVQAGLKALSSLRMEKGYRDYGHDIDNTDTAYTAGLGFAVALDKPGGFLGRQAALAQREAGIPSNRLVQVRLVDPEPLLFHGEVVWRGEPGHESSVGEVRAGSYGWTLGGAVGLAMLNTGDGQPLTQKWLDDLPLSVDIAGERFAAVASLRPMYDPKSERVHM